jgi:hypothetical protein
MIVVSDEEVIKWGQKRLNIYHISGAVPCVGVEGKESGCVIEAVGCS